MNSDSKTELANIDPTSVVVSRRLRMVDGAWVEAIAASIEQKGQDTPIQVRRNGGGLLHLVAGAHRLEACKRLGVEVRAEVIVCSELEARLIEIDENLFRRELGALDRAVFLAERKKVYEEMFPETRRGGKNQHTQNLLTDKMSFSKETAQRVGLNERSIRRAISIAEAIPEDVRKRLVGTKAADSQSDLLFLASLDASMQRKALTLFTDGSAKSLKAAVAKIDGGEEPEMTREERQFAKLTDVWSHAADDVKAQFLKYLRDTGELDS